MSDKLQVITKMRGAALYQKNIEDFELAKHQWNKSDIAMRAGIQMLNDGPTYKALSPSRIKILHSQSRVPHAPQIPTESPIKRSLDSYDRSDRSWYENKEGLYEPKGFSVNPTKSLTRDVNDDDDISLSTSLLPRYSHGYVLEDDHLQSASDSFHAKPPVPAGRLHHSRSSFNSSSSSLITAQDRINEDYNTYRSAVSDTSGTSSFSYNTLHDQPTTVYKPWQRVESFASDKSNESIGELRKNREVNVVREDLGMNMKNVDVSHHSMEAPKTLRKPSVEELRESFSPPISMQTLDSVKKMLDTPQSYYSTSLESPEVYVSDDALEEAIKISEGAEGDPL